MWAESWLRREIWSFTGSCLFCFFKESEDEMASRDEAESEEHLRNRGASAEA